jgi:hypothetical protein
LAEEAEGFRGLGLAFPFPIGLWGSGGVFNATRNAASRRCAVTSAEYVAPSGVFLAAIDFKLP